jgi:amino acid transporter
MITSLKFLLLMWMNIRKLYFHWSFLTISSSIFPEYFYISPFFTCANTLSLRLYGKLCCLMTMWGEVFLVWFSYFFNFLYVRLLLESVWICTSDYIKIWFGIFFVYFSCMWISELCDISPTVSIGPPPDVRILAPHAIMCFCAI